MNCEHETVIVANIETSYCEQCEWHDSDPEIEEGLPCSLDDAEITENLCLVSSWIVCGCFRKKTES